MILPEVVVVSELRMICQETYEYPDGGHVKITIFSELEVETGMCRIRIRLNYEVG